MWHDSDITVSQKIFLSGGDELERSGRCRSLTYWVSQNTVFLDSAPAKMVGVERTWDNLRSNRFVVQRNV